MTVQVVPVHEKAGNMVRCPIALPCVLTTEPSRDTAVAVPDVSVNVTLSPYVQSLLVMVNAGRARPERR